MRWRRRKSDRESTGETLIAPVEFATTADGLVSLKFGPMPSADLATLMDTLATKKGSQEMAVKLREGVEADMAARRAARE